MYRSRIARHRSLGGSLRPPVTNQKRETHAGRSDDGEDWPGVNLCWRHADKRDHNCRSEHRKERAGTIMSLVGPFAFGFGISIFANRFANSLDEAGEED